MKTKDSQLAAGYIRWSTDDQAEGTSPEIQKEAIEKHCRDNNLTLQKLYIDEGKSGWTTKKRPKFLEMRKDGEEGKFNYIVVFKLDRFGRNLKEILINSDDFEAFGIRLISLKENLDTSTPAGRAMRNMMGTFAELDRDSIRERMFCGRFKKWSEGSTFVGKTAFGYIWNKKEKRIEVSPEEAKIYQHIVDLYLLEGLSDLNIALRLKSEGVKLRGKKYPANQTISYILKNPVYYGHCVVNQHEYDNVRRTGKMKPVSEHITVTLPPLISKTKWDEIQRKRLFNKSKAKRVTISDSYWLRDILICDECGSKIYAISNNRTREDGTIPRYYGCFLHKATTKRLESMGKTRCLLPVINADMLEDLVWNHIMQNLTFGGFHLKGQYVPSELETIVDPGRFDEQLTNLTSSLNNLETELKSEERVKGRVLSLLEGEDFNHEEFRQKLAQVNNDITTIKAGIIDIQAIIKTIQENKNSSAEFMDFVTNNREWLVGIVEQLTALSPQDKKSFVESLIPGLITVGIGYKKGSPPSVDFKIVFNKTIFERLAFPR